jgi:GT2 family glycosyltransferase
VPQNQETITAVVVTYNRKDLLGRCLDSLLRQTYPLDGLYLIDNCSTDGTYDFLLGRHLIAEIKSPGTGPVATVEQVPLPGFPGRHVAVHYVRTSENTGGAGGFHEGMKRATEAGFDWLWLMDDDLVAAPEALEVLVQKKNALQEQRAEPFFLNSLALVPDPSDGDTLAFPLQELSVTRDPKTGIPPPLRGVYHWRLSEVRGQVRDGLYRWACLFNGTFLPAQAVREVGLPDRDFFLWGDERDFQWRAARRFHQYTVVASRVFHPPARTPQFDWRQYYLFRNTFVVNRHFRYAGLRNIRVTLLGLLLGLRHGRSGLALMLRAIRDGWTGRLGKRDDLHP